MVFGPNLKVRLVLNVHAVFLGLPLRNLTWLYFGPLQKVKLLAPKIQKTKEPEKVEVKAASHKTAKLN